MVASLTAGQMLGLGSAFAGLGLGGNLVTSALSSHRAWKYAQRAMALQYEYQKKGLLEGPSLSRKGYTDAGYNPLLALGNTGSIGNISSPNVPDMTADMPDLATSAVGAINGYKEGKLLDTNINSAQTDLEIKKQQLEKLQSENKTSIKNLLTNPEARSKFIEGLPSALKGPVNSAVQVANAENKIGKIEQVVRQAIPEHPKLADKLMNGIYGSYKLMRFSPRNYAYNLGKDTLRYIKKLHNTHSARSGFVTAGKHKYQVEYLPDNIGYSNLIK